MSLKLSAVKKAFSKVFAFGRQSFCPLKVFATMCHLLKYCTWEATIRFQLLNYVAVTEYSVHCWCRSTLRKSIRYHFNFVSINANQAQNVNQSDNTMLMIIAIVFVCYIMIFDDFKIVPEYRKAYTARPSITYDSFIKNSKRFHKWTILIFLWTFVLQRTEFVIVGLYRHECGHHHEYDGSCDDFHKIFVK